VEEGAPPPTRARANTQGDTVGEEPAAAAKGSGKGGKGKGKGKNRRRRKTTQGRAPEQIKSNDKKLHYFLSIMARLSLQTATTARMAIGLLVTTILGDKAAEPFAAAIDEQEKFKEALKQVRLSDETNKPLGAPHHQIFHSFVTSLNSLDIGGAQRSVLTEWLAAITQDPNSGPKAIEAVCQAFQCYPVRSDQNRVRLQIAMVPGPIRTAILTGLDNIEIKISTGPAPRSFLEEELADWLACLNIERD